MTNDKATGQMKQMGAVEQVATPRDARSDPYFDDEIQLSENACPKCHETMYTRPCGSFDCEDGGYHDCGDDSCCCLEPAPNTACDECRGYGFHEWCRKCGWDAHEKRYLK